MSILLARLGAGSFRHPVVVLLLWALLLVGVVGLAGTADTQVSTSITVGDTSAQQVLDRVQAELPEAAGAQGTVVFRAEEGRVDQGRAAEGVAAALKAGVDTGRVVDREAMRAEQEAELRAKATESATARTGEEITRGLEGMGAGLLEVDEVLRNRSEDVAVQLALLATGQPPPLQPWQQEQLAGSGAPAPTSPAQLGLLLEDMQGQLDTRAEELAGIGTSVVELLAAPVEQQLDGVVQLSSRVQELTEADPAAAEMLRAGSADGTSLLLTSGQDPREQIEEKVDEQVAAVMGDLGRLQGGTSPAGRPLVVDGEQVPGATVSADGTIAVLQVQLTEQLDDLPAGAAEEVVTALTGGAAAAGLQAYPSDSLQPLEPPVGGHEALGLLVAGVVLLLTLGSLVAAGLPLLTALLGVAIGVGGAFGLSEFYDMTSTTPVLALMLGLAVGIDYALFILDKQRRLILERGMSAREAAATAVGTAGSAVLFAGLTVIVALLGLLVLDIGFVTTMAVAASATVGLAVLVSLTALPALLGLAGERIVSRRARARSRGAHRSPTGGAARRWAGVVTARPWLVVVAVVALLGLAALPAADMRLGMPGGASASAGSPERLNADLTAQALGPGATGPLLVTVERPAGTDSHLDRIGATLEDLARVDGVADAALRGTDKDGTLEIYAVTPEEGPMDPSTEELVHTLRQPEVVDGVDELGVTGLTAINIDLSQRLAEAVPVYLGVVVVLALFILLLVFRSLVIPLVATLGFLLTVGASFGLTTAVFGTATLGWLAGVDRPGVVLSFLPIMATGILYGLAMDYQVFLTTAMREAHVHGSAGRGAVAEGFAHASRVVVAAAVIMVSVFAVFVLTDDPVITQFGFALAVGVLIDAFLVRMTLMPALLHAVGDAAWWLPPRLDRLLPELDVEGSRLERAPGPATPDPRPAGSGEPEAGAVGDAIPVRS
ncbi:MMPL family transporter [Ornithinimicrobium avium]|uniref:MMPL family transporter n=1 Tax=Ornithinimicrobium avium TaxID=2283195 RepID=A0A345NL90_9MICO|nr:MMPL family transporter [Ornithinimicrobium avium]AXH95798.1 MMPL family transporter [Ornithinimicrobium avium]